MADHETYREVWVPNRRVSAGTLCDSGVDFAKGIVLSAGKNVKQSRGM
jgi:hypothetical protein